MLYINDLLPEVDCISCLPFVYADDVQFVCYSSIEFLDVLENSVNFVIERVVSWSFDNAFSVNSLKTKLMGFGFDTRNMSIRINNEPVEFVDSMKCLGVILDKLLNFSSHVNLLSSRVYIFTVSSQKASCNGGLDATYIILFGDFYWIFKLHAREV